MATILWIGSSRPEPWAQCLSDAREAAQVDVVRDLNAALECKLEESSWNLIVLVNTGGGEHDQAEFQKFRARLPFTPIVAIIGPWAEADGRAGLSLPGVATASFASWKVELAVFLAALAVNRLHSWHFPDNYAMEDRMLLSQEPLPTSTNDEAECNSKTVLICCDNASDARALQSAIVSFGYVVHIASPTATLAQAKDCDMVVVDQRDGATTGTFQYPTRATVWIANFPRPEDLPHSSKPRGDVVLTKPFSLQLLRKALEQAGDRTN